MMLNFLGNIAVFEVQGTLIALKCRIAMGFKHSRFQTRRYAHVILKAIALPPQPFIGLIQSNFF